MAIIILAFVPVFALTGQEGKLFPSRSRSRKTFAMVVYVAAVTIVPCAVLRGSCGALFSRGA